ncbi:MAG: hypothetical protein HY719_09435 [Planctomycetes bacterium]|nr:hypothetical protein [Planctomycetota bacterium]
MKHHLARHARTALQERAVPLEWLEGALAAQELKAPDPTDAELEHRHSGISEQGNRVLYVGR